MRRPARTFFFLRNFIAGLPLVWALFTTRGQWEHDAAAWSAALLMAGAGISLRAWSSCHCNYASRRPKNLAVTGPYGLVRNPLYIGNILVLVGATIASEVLWLIPVTILWSWAIYALTVRLYEEPHMHARYGEAWERYCSVVPAWVPALRRTSLAAPSFLKELAPQTLRLLFLVPFLFKELHMFGLGTK